MIWLFTFMISSFAMAQIQSDCSPAEMKALQSADIVNLMSDKAKVFSVDCAPFKAAPDKEWIVSVHVLNSTGGLETFFNVFERKGFNEKAQPLKKSGVIAFDAFPMLVNKVNRLLFVHPSSDRAKLAVFLNVQTGPSASRFGRWEFNFETKELNELSNRMWIVEAGILPKIYDDRGSYRALIETRSVEL